MASENETVAMVLLNFEYLITLGNIGPTVATDIKRRLEDAHQREVAELKHWIKSAARWIKCHDIYHTSGGDLIKQAKEILNDDGEFMFKKGE